MILQNVMSALEVLVKSRLRLYTALFFLATIKGLFFYDLRYDYISIFLSLFFFPAILSIVTIRYGSILNIGLFKLFKTTLIFYLAGEFISQASMLLTSGKFIFNDSKIAYYAPLMIIIQLFFIGFIYAWSATKKRFDSKEINENRIRNHNEK